MFVFADEHRLNSARLCLIILTCIAEVWAAHASMFSNNPSVALLRPSIYIHPERSDHKRTHVCSDLIKMCPEYVYCEHLWWDLTSSLDIQIINPPFGIGSLRMDVNTRSEPGLWLTWSMCVCVCVCVCDRTSMLMPFFMMTTWTSESISTEWWVHHKTYADTFSCQR